MDSQITEIAYGVKVLYEDNHLIVAIKPAGVLSQSDGSNAPDMLTILKAYIKDKYQKPGEVYLGLVHRLDRPVSGVMVFARTSKAASRLSEQIRTRRVEKIYRCVVNGVLEGEGRLENFISKDEASNSVTVSDVEKPGFKASYLDYRALASKDGMTLVEVKNLHYCKTLLPKLLNYTCGLSQQSLSRMSQSTLPISMHYHYLLSVEPVCLTLKPLNIYNFNLQNYI